MIDPVRRNEFIEAATQNRRNGSRNWKANVFDKFPDIPRATAYRLLNRVCDREQSIAAGAAPYEIDEPTQRDDTKINTPKKEDFVPSKTPGPYDPTDNLPLPDQLLKIRQLYEDAYTLKQRSLDKNGKIKNIAVFQKSIELRLKIVVADANMAVAASNAERLETVLNGIVNIAKQHDPEAGIKLMRDVKHYYESMAS